MLRFQVSFHNGASPTGALSVNFDDSLTTLQQFDRLFIEPDGAFVWSGSTPAGEAWQVDGNLIDRGDFLAYVELKGRCPEDEFDRMLSVLGWPAEPLMFQLPRRGVFLTEPEFRALAASDDGAL